MIEPTVDPATWRAEQKRVSHRLKAAVSVFLVSVFLIRGVASRCRKTRRANLTFSFASLLTRT